MGEALHGIVLETRGTRCRIYAPVGAHRDLLAYLVRRLLENGANSSFVNQVVDKSLAPETVAADPLTEVAALAVIPNPGIRPPAELFKGRANAKGWNVNEPASVLPLIAAREDWRDPCRGDRGHGGDQPGRSGRRGGACGRGECGGCGGGARDRARRLRGMVGDAGIGARGGSAPRGGSL